MFVFCKCIDVIPQDCNGPVEIIKIVFLREVIDLYSDIFIITLFHGEMAVAAVISRKETKRLVT